MNTYEFQINNESMTFDATDCPCAQPGHDTVLSGPDTDITYNQPWYRQGYTVQQMMVNDEFHNLKNQLTIRVRDLVAEQLGLVHDDFTLERYHRYVTSHDMHSRIVNKTRDLYPSDFGFDISAYAHKLERILGFELTDINPYDSEKMHIIVRINRPQSSDYNPPHKDIYEGFDASPSYIPQFVNVWIPVAGVDQNSSLPLVPSSHLLSEKLIVRTTEGAVLNGNHYRVRMITRWDGSNKLVRAHVIDGEALIFSSHLVHGLAINSNLDRSRVALEFRLFRKGAA